MPSQECEEEFQVLESIYKEIQIGSETKDGDSFVSILLYPKSADDMDSRYVTLRLEFQLAENYPDSTPTIQIKNPRGLSEDQLSHLEDKLKKMKDDFAGSPMLFQLIDMVHEYLTINNRPSTECPICLMSFGERDVFYTPTCFHHYHAHCLGLHLQSVFNAKTENEDSDQSKLLCPVCRQELESNIDIEKLLDAPPASEELMDNHSKAAYDYQTYGQLYEKQKKQGGIIDLAQDCQQLLRISEHVTSELSSSNSNGSGGLVDQTQTKLNSSKTTTNSQSTKSDQHGATSVKPKHGTSYNHQRNYKPFRDGKKHYRHYQSNHHHHHGDSSQHTTTTNSMDKDVTKHGRVSSSTHCANTTVSTVGSVGNPQRQISSKHQRK